ncbi:diaminobutyrate acetyltransferase [Allohahella marinimesophila]|uniref:diaminobutyrate acetyltransferase n=1 Tax=Allohahella marinimesophila TaxID=1054972 RepID=UPI0031E2663F
MTDTESLKSNAPEQSNITLREPRAEDGASVFDLISLCPPLDTNSMYCNLLQASHFAGTSVAAVRNDVLCGFISGYLIPNRPNVLFIWQVAVHESARGQKLASRMLEEILGRTQCSQVTELQTTITKNNEASWSLFQRLAKNLDAPLNTSVMFDRKTHFDDRHDTEMLVSIGPFAH